MLNRILALFALLPLMLISDLDAKPVSWSDFSYQEAKFEALMAYKPLMTYVYQADHIVSKRMEQQTWESNELASLLETHFMANKTLMDQMPESDFLYEQVSEEGSPFILIFHPQGHVLSRIEGFVAPQTLLNILNRHLKNIEPVASEDIVVQDIRISEQQMHAAYGTTRSQNPNHNFSDIPGMESMGLHGQVGEKVSPGHYILVVSAKEQLRGISKEVRKLKKFWRGEIFTFQHQRDVENKPRYLVALGSFDTQETAETFAATLWEYEDMYCQPIKVSDLLF